MTKLNQIIAVEKGIKSTVKSAVTDLYKAAQKPELFNGMSKHYEPVSEQDEILPPENKRVQFTAQGLLKEVSALMSKLFDVTAKKDWANTEAKADVTVDGKVLVIQAPVSFLLFLEKELTDIRTFINHLPVLDPADDWSQDVNSGLYKTGVVKTHRTKKVPKPVVLYPATAEHPAQTQLFAEDVLAGHWNAIKQSGALPKPEKQALLERAEVLLQAVKQAREAANSQEVKKVPDIGQAVFGYLLGA